MKKVLFLFTILYISIVSGNAQVSIIDVTTTNVSCNADNDGSVTISATGGVKPYYYYIQKGGEIYSSPATTDTVYTFSNVKANNWIVLVEDFSGNTDFSTGLVTQPAPLNITSENITDISCTGYADGELSVTATGESGSYIYTLNPTGTVNTTGSFTGLAPGNYTISVEDASGCSTTDVSNTLPLSDPAPIAVSTETSSDISCYGSSDGTVDVTASGGTGAYTFTLNPGGQSNNSGSFGGLDAGIYTVEVTDINGCPSATSSPLGVNEPAELVISSETSSNISCNGADDGNISVTASGGNGPYTFTLNPGGPTNSTGIFSNLAPGNYTVSVSDANSCGPVVSNSFAITEPDPINIDNISSADISCNNADDGSINIVATGGNAPLTYTLNPGGSSNLTGNFTGLAEGSYTVDIFDAAGCPPLTSSAVLINNPPPITIDSESATDISCNGADDGSIQVTAKGGTGSLHYTLMPAGTVNSSGSFSGLSAGTYTVNVTDDNACPVAISNPLTINEPAPVTINSESTADISCFGAGDGSISVSASGGNAPLLYTLNPGASANNTGNFAGLDAGTYTVSVSDASGCPGTDSNPLTIDEPDQLVITSEAATDMSCSGTNDGTISVTTTGGTAPLTYTINPDGSSNNTGSFSGLSAGSYTITVEDANLCPPVSSSSIDVNEPPAITISSFSSEDISCNGAGDGTINVSATGGTGNLEYTLNPGAITNTTGTFSGLAAGTYTVSVSDQNACPPVSTPDIIINEPAKIHVVVQGSSNLSLDCNGDNSGSININVNGGTSPYVYSWTSSSGFSSDSEDISDLTAGIYNLDVTDANGCSAGYPALAEITEPLVLQMSLSKTDVVCNGDANGSVTVTASGGTAPYQYSRNGITFQPSNVFNGLVKNTYTIYVKDSKDCITSDTISIAEPEDLQVASEIRIDNNLCHGDSLGEIRILSVIGGTAPYEYSINGGADFYDDPVFLDLPAGSYQTVVQDAAGCSANGNLNVINEPSEIRISSYAQSDVTGCFGNTNGQIAIDANGGTGAKTYTLDGGSSNSTGIFNSVGGGTHLITITDINSCSKDTTVIISQPVEIVWNSISITHITGCGGSSNGEISATASGGTGTLLYALDGGAFQGSGDFTGLSAGNHTLSVQDDNGCQKDTLLVVTEPAALAISNETATDILCSGEANGSISVTATGGTAPYTYTLNPGAVSNSSGNFTGLSAGTYTVEVNDSNGCGPVTGSSVTISEPSPVVMDSVTKKDVLCNGDTDAEIHIYASGGVPPYQYSIDDEASYSSSGDFTGLSAGTYYLSLQDANGCKLYIDTISIAEPPALVATAESSSDVSTCAGDSTGSVSWEVTGGSGNIEYSMDGLNWQSSGDFTNLPAGSYTITARDANGCSLTSPELTVNQPEPITADMTSSPDPGNVDKGIITISGAKGGTGNLVFSVTGTTGTFTSDTVFSGLDEGIYTVVVMDDNGCFLERKIEVSPTPALDVNVSVQNISCYGNDDGAINLMAANAFGTAEYSVDDSLTWSQDGSFTDLEPGEYIIFARDTAERYFSDTVRISEPTQISIFSNITPATCSSSSTDGAIDVTVGGAQGNITYTWSTGASTQDLKNLKVGRYHLKVEDEEGCTVSDSIEVPALTKVDAFAGNDTTICAGTDLMLKGIGGTDLSWYPSEGMSDTTLSNPVVNINEDMAYILRVDGMYNCYDLDTIRISVYPKPELSAGPDTIAFEREPVFVEVSGGPYESYQWIPETGIDDPTASAVKISPSESTVYLVSATDENGCVNTDTIEITVVNNLKVYNAFSPNDDGVNDYWDIDHAEFYPNITVEVFNRWGERLFSSQGYSDENRWDGTYRGSKVPIGTYYYVIVPYTGATTITGTVTIVR